MSSDAEEYVEYLFEESREAMIHRASWINDHRPSFQQGVFHHGGQETSILYKDAQLSYIFGTFPGAIVLGQSYIERAVCGFAYSSGEFSEGERPTYHDAVDFLSSNDLVQPDEVEGVPLDELNNLRNPIVHFRPVTDESTLRQRSIEQSFAEDGEFTPKTATHLLKEDSEEVLKTVFSIVHLFGLGPSSE